MMHALIRDDQIIETRHLRETWWDGTRYWDFSDTGHDPADHGWLPLVYTDRPADTATTTWERDEPRLVDGVPTVGWVERDKTPEELQAEAQAQVADTLTVGAAADLSKIEQAIADTLALLGPNDQEGSIRHHRSTILTNQYAVSAQRAQDDLILSLAVVVRRLARQVARLSRLQTGTFDSADVGPDAT